ncbi:MAG: hypothetical protein C5B53_06120 [Candidatus Melainabacteria bacterium]|nr:MAG: hypothetical protein C5B53_06120 [Candidatus Melainabacteria bacterium]
MSKDGTDQKCDSIVGSLVHSFGHTLIQGPIDGTTEVINSLCEKKVIPKVEIVKAPVRAPYGSASHTAQKMGEGAGFVGLLLIVGRFVRFPRFFQ